MFSYVLGVSYVLYLLRCSPSIRQSRGVADIVVAAQLLEDKVSDIPVRDFDFEVLADGFKAMLVDAGFAAFDKVAGSHECPVQR